VLHTAALVLERESRDASAPTRRPDDEFLARLAHELRNPLAPLRNAIELISRPGVEAGMIDKACSIMSRQVTRLAALIDEMTAPAHRPPLSSMAPAAEPDPAPVAMAVPAPPGRRVLVADDNDLVRESFVELLEREGYEVRTAVDGLQAVEIAEHWQPQEVMLDIHMPRLSGLETARRLRASHAPQVMTLLMMSGMSLNEAWIRHAKAAGFDDCLDKTGDPQRWLQRLRQALH